MTVILGVDAGNTKTVALVANERGTILGAGRSGCGDIYAAGGCELGDAYGRGSPAAALAAVDEAIAGALAAAGCTIADVAGAGFSMAGADWPEDYALLEAAMWERGYRRFTVVNDAIGALLAGSPDGTGVVVACGTGVATGARRADGRTWHGSFWQEANGASELGRRALRAVYRAELGLDPPTTLTGRILTHFGRATVEEVLHSLTARPVAGQAIPTGRIGGLSRLLLDEAAAGDAVAVRIVREQGMLLGDYALVSARRVGIDRTPFWLVLTGGVFRHPGPQLAAVVVERVQREQPAARPLRGRLEPAIGAVVLGFETAKRAIDDDVRQRLATTAPASSFFET